MLQHPVAEYKTLLKQGLKLKTLVGATRFELATPASRTQYSTRLSYAPISLDALPPGKPNEAIAAWQQRDDLAIAFYRERTKF